MECDGFINIDFNANNIDLYWIRMSIRNALMECMPQFKGRLLDVGCGRMPYKDFILDQSDVVDYIGLDIEERTDRAGGQVADKTWDGKTMPFEDDLFDTAIATEVLEHCPRPDQTLREIYRVLAQDGLFFFTVPFLWNLHEVPYDEYRYTPFALERHLRESGFESVQIRATGGWHASMAQMLGLWVRRSPMTERKRYYLSILFKPVMKYLLNKDTIPDRFRERTMITGLYGTGLK